MATQRSVMQEPSPTGTLRSICRSTQLRMGGFTYPKATVEPQEQEFRDENCLILGYGRHKEKPVIGAAENVQDVIAVNVRLCACRKSQVRNALNRLRVCADCHIGKHMA